jgi:hypothetical protein
LNLSPELPKDLIIADACDVLFTTLPFSPLFVNFAANALRLQLFAE